MCVYVSVSVCVCVCVCVARMRVCALLGADGQKRGFAFVQFTNVFSAGQAVEALNGSKMKGTPVSAHPEASTKSLSQSRKFPSAVSGTPVKSTMGLGRVAVPSSGTTQLLCGSKPLHSLFACFGWPIQGHSFLPSLDRFSNTADKQALKQPLAKSPHVPLRTTHWPCTYMPHMTAVQ